MISLCIPTMDRYDNFLSKTLHSYVNNPYIHEIIICDENGEDVKKIKNVWQSEKLKLHTNEKRLGPFLNKLKCCCLAQNEWIALIDSDNFADTNYFQACKEFIQQQSFTKKNIILAPVAAMPNFDFSNLLNVPISKETMKTNNNISNMLLNTGNFVINKDLINHIDIRQESEIIEHSSACDVLLFTTLLLEQLDMQMYIVPNMKYNHTTHSGSIYLTTINQTRKYAEQVYARTNRLRKHT